MSPEELLFNGQVEMGKSSGGAATGPVVLRGVAPSPPPLTEAPRLLRESASLGELFDGHVENGNHGTAPIPEVPRAAEPAGGAVVSSGDITVTTRVERSPGGVVVTVSTVSVSR